MAFVPFEDANNGAESYCLWTKSDSFSVQIIYLNQKTTILRII